MSGERAMEEIIDFVLRKNRGSITAGMSSLQGESPLEALMRQEEGDPDEEWKVRDETMCRLFAYIFAAGPEPLEVLRRVYGLTKAVYPSLLGDLSLEDIALLSGDGGRATVSARIKRIYNKKLEEAGMKGNYAAFQKSAGAVEKFAKAQRGNSNRSNKRRRRPAKTKKPNK